MRRISILLLVFCTCFAVSAWSQAQPRREHNRVLTFAVPGAGTSANQGTYVNRIVWTGAVAGWYIDGNNASHGFIRRPDGVITKVDAPAAQQAPYLGTWLYGMNWEGATTGYYVDPNNVYHGFLRSPAGRFTTIDVPIAGTGQWQGTIACNINTWGTVHGIFIDANNSWHYFLRSPDGEFTTFDPPDADVGLGVAGLGWGYPDALNDAGATTSIFLDASEVLHGWLRTPDGTLVRIDAPGAGTGSWEGTFSTAINEEGAIVGGFIGPGGNWGTVQGFVRDAHGRITAFAPPPGKGTVQSGSMNSRGEIVGTCWKFNADGNSVGPDADAAFSRAPNGTYSVFSLPGAGTGNYQGSFGIDVSPQGWIAGYITDDNFVTKSFVILP